MLDWIFYILNILYNVIFYFLIFDFVVIRTLPVFYFKWYYGRQGIPYIKPCYPIVGATLRLLKNTKLPLAPFYVPINEDFGEQPPAIVAIMNLFLPILVINRPELLEELFMTKNKYLDKDPMVELGTRPILGESVLTQQTNESWAKKRKSLTSAFYKDKLIKMTDKIKVIVGQKINEWDSKYLDNGKEMDLVQEINDLNTRIITCVAFGMNSADITLPYLVNGKPVQKPIAEFIRQCFGFLTYRGARKEIVWYPWILFLYYRQEDKDWLVNVKTLRDVARDLILKRKQQLESQDQNVDESDLLTILLKDENYKDNIEMIISECMTFFVAGSQTVKSANINILQYLMINKDIHSKVMEELKSHVLKGQKSPINIVEAFNYENTQELSYFSMVFNEALRIEPPLSFSMAHTFTEHQTLGPYYIRKGQQMILSIHQLHHNPDEWIEHERFIPERFDPSSKYFLNSKGQKRNPLSYAPFFGGRRVCLGKTFAEVLSRFVAPCLLTKFDFEYVNKDFYNNKPLVNAVQIVEPVIMVKIKKALTY